MTKNEEKALRVKYLRNLEKFFNDAISALKKEDFDKTKFEERMLKNAKFFEKNPAVNLNSTYAKNLEFFVNACLDFSKEKNELLNLANALDKQKKQGGKKEKHKNYLKDYE
ncbi:hypothetical protein GYL97_000056 [Campylobacter jejuni]|nr:hypothetical protein [Campylobacter jejuni]EDP4345617.1 hypothetical protein [Campylobacter jejuni]EGF0313526.1 hypothetical protein [Campylobacter jejuni]EGF5470511.1 hypothetical protein [Campylobacter jejuni]